VSRKIYLDASAVIRATVEAGASPEVESVISEASLLLCSRLALVESARLFHRLRSSGQHPEALIADLERAADDLWARCEVWELSAQICDAAMRVAPTKSLRALDALHLATYLAARRRFGGPELLTVDDRLKNAAGVA
jgi:predicted nucleic acid-binding protein